MARLVIEIGQGEEAQRILAALREKTLALGGSARILNDDLKKLGRQNAATERRFNSLAASLDPAIAKQHAMARATKTLERALQQGVVSQQEHNRLLQLAQQRYSGATTAASGYGATLGKLSGLVGGLSFAILARDLVSTIASFETLRARLVTVTGSAQSAQAAFALIKDFAKTTPFTIQEVTDSFVRLSAQGITPTREVLLSFGNTAAAMGKSFAQFSEAVLDAATGEFERLKEFGIKAKTTGDQVTFTFRGMSTTVQKEAGAIVGYLQQIGETDFAGAMERQNQTLSGQFSNLKDNASQLADALGTAGVAGSMGEALQAANNLVGGLALLAESLSGVEGEGGKVSKFIRELIQRASGLGMISNAINDIADAIRNLAGAEQAPQGSPFDASAWLSSHEAAREELDRLKSSTTGVASTMDEASKRVFAAAKAAAELAKEVEGLTKKYSPAVAQQREWAKDLTRLVELYRQGQISGAMLATALADIEQEYQKLVALGDQQLDLPSADLLLDRIEKGFAQQVKQLEQDAADLQEAFDAITDINLDSLGSDPMVKILDAEKNHAAEVTAIWEGTWGDIYSLGANALHGFIDGAKVSWEDLGKELLHIFADLLLRLLQEWLTHEATKTAITATEAGKRAALETGGKGASGGGGGMGSMGGGGGGWMQTAFGTSGGNASSAMYGVGWAAVAIAAIAALSNAFQKSRDGRRYDTQVGVSMRDGDMFSGVSGVATETGAKILDAMRGLVGSIQETTGVLLEGITQATIEIRHDKERFRATVNGEIVGVFKTAEEAILAAVKAMFSSEAMAQALDPAVQQVITNFQGDDPAQLAEAVQFVQGIVDAASGLSEIELALRALPAQAMQVENSLRSMGVSMTDASRLADLWAINQLATMRDQITGRQRTAEEEMALRQQQAVMWNAQRMLMEVELQGQLEALKGKRAIIEAGGVMAEIEVGIAKERLGSLAQVIQTEAELYNAELEVRKDYTEASAEIINISLQMLNQQIAAIEGVLGQLADIPLIDPGEIRLPNLGGGGGAGAVDTGPQLPSPEEWREEIAQYTRTALEGQVAEIRNWADEQREIATQIGESIELVNDAERARLAALGEQIVGGLGVASVEVEQRFAGLAETLDFLRNNLEALGISADRFAEITRELGDQMFLSLADGLLQFVDNEQVKQELAQIRYQMEIANYRLQFELLRSLGILTQEQIDLIQGLIDALPTEAPTLGGGGFGGGFGGGGGGRQLPGLNERLDALRRAIERLRDFYEDLYHDEALSPLSIAEQFALAQQEWTDLLALAQTGDPDAIAALPEAAQQFLALAAQMFGTSTQSYLDIFNAVVGAIEGILGDYEEPDAWYWLQTSMGTVTNKLTSSNNHLQAIRNEIVGWPGGPGGGPGGRVPVGGEGSIIALVNALQHGASAAHFGAAALALSQGRQPAANAGNVLAFRPRIMIQSQPPSSPGADTTGLRREIENLGRRLDQALDRLARAQESAGERRARAAWSGAKRP